MERQIAVNDKSPFWRETALVLSQMDGVSAGHNMACPSAELGPYDVAVLNMQGDMGDVLRALLPSARPDWRNMTQEQAVNALLPTSHCSSIIKSSPDFSRLYFAHTMWWSYYSMTRIAKVYNLGSAASAPTRSKVSLTSYPATLSSTDDWYYSHTAKLHVMETTNSIFNNSLYGLIRKASVVSWIRVTVANRLAVDGQTWKDVFKTENSGTYNNMWQVTDLKKFSPKESLQPGLLTVCEQIPGLVRCHDQTETLARGYWPSYNNAYDPEIRDLSGYTAQERKLGTYFSYELNPRAEIMRRDQGNITDLTSLQRMWRYNNYQHEPFARDQLGRAWPSFTIAARGDLKATSLGGPAFTGATDAKVASSDELAAGRFHMIYGPTHEDEPVFDWGNFPNTTEPHEGQPARFGNYTWTEFMGE